MPDHQAADDDEGTDVSRHGKGQPAIPDPGDRVWRHPAEIAAAQRAANISSGNTAPSAPSSRSAAAVAALGGGLLITGLWLAMGSTSTAPVAGAGQPLATETAQAPLPTAVANSTVELRDGDGELLGFGVAIGAGDQIITAAHSLGDEIQVVLPDGSSVVATAVGHDKLSGLTALRLPARSLTPAVIAGAEPTELAGTVAGFDNPSDISLITVPGGGDWSHAVFDMPERAGHLGSPVVDADGSLVGLVTGYDESRTQITSIATVERVAEQLFSRGIADHPWLGIEGRDHPGTGGALITAIVPGGPAVGLGLESGDLIVGVGSVDIDSMADLLGAVRIHRPGDTIVLEIQANTTVRRVPVELGRMADA